MKKHLAPLILAVPLLLAGCGNAENTPPPEAPADSLSATTTTPPGPPDTKIGQTVIDNCAPAMPCEIEFQVDDIRVSEVCETGLAEYSDPIDDGQLLLTVEGEATAVQTIHEGHFHTFDNPDYEDADGYSTSGPNVTDPCNSHEGDLWSDPLHDGTKKRMIDTWIMPSDATHMIFAGYRYELPKPTSTRTSSAPQATSTQTSVAPEPEARPTSIWTAPGTGYNCPQTDAWVIDASYCTPENLGAIPSQDLSTIPYSEGGTCPAYKCGYGTDVEGNDLNQEKAESHASWGECISANTAEYCRANDPWQQ